MHVHIHAHVYWPCKANKCHSQTTTPVTAAPGHSPSVHMDKIVVERNIRLNCLQILMFDNEDCHCVETRVKTCYLLVVHQLVICQQSLICFISISRQDKTRNSCLKNNQSANWRNMPDLMLHKFHRALGENKFC